jgi:thymidylate synthase
MDALTHAVEAFIGNTTTASTRKHSLNAVKLIFENLKEVYDNGSNLEARQKVSSIAIVEHEEEVEEAEVTEEVAATETTVEEPISETLAPQTNDSEEE